MRWNLVLLAFVALPISAAPGVPVDVAEPLLAHDAEQRWVPFELTPGNQIRFAMNIGGTRATAILDTGVSTSVASRLFANRASLKLEPGRGERADAIGGAVPLGWTRVERLSLGALTQARARLAVVDLSAIATGGAEPVDILIGSDLLACCALDIDYAARRFRLLPSGRMPFAGPRAPLARLPRTGVFSTAATIAGRQVRPLIVDTGDGAALTLSRTGWAGLRAKPAATTSAVAFGLGGAIETDLAVLPSVRFGSVGPVAIETRIEPKGGFSDQTGTIGRLGNGLFQRYRVLMDARAGHMILSPTATAKDAPVRSTSGLLVGYDSGRLSVLHVMRGSPAAAAGWKAREQICTVDGTPVPPPTGGSVDTGWSAGAPGRVLRFGMCDGTERRLTLKNFY
ncbi:aspartyl protease family protein [uncultured Sphingomonas sp.]|uniref:retropepsin-like aspartic protease n=1 Tax=uncultured Sphingomonas sp. TaxID=158754 RepID=UPI0025D476F7|nr:aspartyl protease family protein [uncultured Sphingomonas sp.]